MAANTLAMEAMTLAVSGMVDRSKKGDIRVEAAMAKLWATERAWEIVDDTMQIRGGRGYETAASQKARGERPVPVERWFRDCRINTIFEGSSEIMRLFIAREVLDPHLKIGAAVLNSTLPWAERARAAVKAALFYACWYPRQWVPGGGRRGLQQVHPDLRRHVKMTRRASRRLARSLFHAMLRYGPKLDKEQVLLGRFVDIGTELFATATTMSYVSEKVRRDENLAAELLPVADYFGALSDLRVRRLFADLRHGGDRQGQRLAESLLEEAAG